MTDFRQRVVRAAALDRRIYEEVEADRTANGQAVLIVLLAATAGGIGLAGMSALHLPNLISGLLGALVGWVAWALLTYYIGTQLLPEPQTQADAGQLLRTLAFAASPGLLRILGVIPILGALLYGIASIWMLLAVVVAVRQALDYRSTGRAVAVCLVGWLLSLIIAAVIGIVFAPSLV